MYLKWNSWWQYKDPKCLKGYGATWKSGVHVIILSFFSEFLLIHQLKVKDYIMKLFHIAIPFVLNMKGLT